MTVQRPIYAVAILSVVAGLTATLFVAAGRYDQMTRYPNATLVAPSEFALNQYSSGQFRVSDAAYTSDDMGQVVGWYMQALGPASARAPVHTGNCLIFSKAARFLFLRQEISVSLCSQVNGSGTWIDVSRQMGLVLPGRV